MCASSVVYDYAMKQWPNTGIKDWDYFRPLIPNVTTEAEKQALEAFRDLVKQAEKFDKDAGQPECEDPQKAQVLDRILERLEVIEQRLNIVE